jgi:GTP-binding protein SAR1
MNFITSMWNGVMKLLGLYKKDARIIFLGLDDAGKTTLLSVLKDGRVEQFDPTIHAHAEELEIGKLKLCTVDLGGHETVRKVWRDYFPKIDAIVYLIDASNSARFGEGKEEFDNVMETADLGEIPILILGNKIDKV